LQKFDFSEPNPGRFITIINSNSLQEGFLPKCGFEKIDSVNFPRWTQEVSGGWRKDLI